MKITLLTKQWHLDDMVKNIAIMGHISRNDGTLQDSINAIEDGKGGLLKSVDFAKKWIKTHQHNTLAEHCVLQLYFEDIPIYLAKYLEKNRIGVSITERSTTYSTFSSGGVTGIKKDFDEQRKIFNNSSLDKYVVDIPKLQLKDGKSIKVTDVIKRHYEKYMKNIIESYISMNEKVQAYNERLKEVDCRKIHGTYNLYTTKSMLPSAALTSVALTLNIRALKRLIDDFEYISYDSNAVALRYNLISLINDTSIKEIYDWSNNLDKNEHPKLKDNLDKNESLFNEINKLPRTCKVVKFDNIYEPNDKSIHISHNINEPLENLNDEELIDELKIMWKKYATQIKNNKNVNDVLDRLSETYATHTISMDIDYGTFRDLQRHRLSSMIYDDFNIPYSKHNESLYVEPILEPYNGNDENLIHMHKEILESYNSFISEVVYSGIIDMEKKLGMWFTILRNHNNYEISSDDEKRYTSLIISNMNVLSSIKRVSMHMNTRSLVKMMTTRIKVGGAISYRTLSLSICREIMKQFGSHFSLLKKPNAIYKHGLMIILMYVILEDHNKIDPMYIKKNFDSYKYFEKIMKKLK